MSSTGPRPTAPVEHGFTLLELLVVVVLVAVLAAIAIPGFLGQRRTAWETAAVSDLRNAVVELETVADDHGYPDELVPVGERDRVLELRRAGEVLATTNLSPGVELVLGCTDDPDDPDRICVCADHAQLGRTVSVFDSTSGQLHDPDEVDVDCITHPAGAPVLVMPDLTGFFTCDEDGVCRYDETNRVDAGRMLFEGGQLTSDGSLLLSDAWFSGDRDSGYGWAITYGSHDEHGQMGTGYTLQLDPGYRPPSFVIRTWDTAGRHHAGRTPQAVPIPDGFDFASPADIEARVENGFISLYVDGTRHLHYEMGDHDHDASTLDGPGTFGIRTWGADPEVSFRDPRLQLRD